MFCPHCGTQVNDGARFCPKCGAQLQVRPTAAPMPAPTPAAPAAQAAPPATPVASAPAQAAPSTGGSGGKGKLIAIIAAVAVVVVALVVIFFVIKPFDQGGAPSGGTQGSAAASAETSQSAEAAQGQQVPAASEEPALTLKQAYAQVLQDLIGTYGPAQVKKLDSQVTALDGVGFAMFKDFNSDGTDELMLAYYDPSKNTMSGALRSNDSYRVEVWAYDGKKANLVHEQSAENSNGGELYVTLIENTSDTKAAMPELLKTVEYPNGTIFDTLTTYYGFDGNAFVPVKTYEVIAKESSGADSVVYKIDGKEVDKATYDKQAPYSVLTGDTVPFKLLEFDGSSDMSWGFGVDGVKEITDTTVAELSMSENPNTAAGNDSETRALTDLAFAGFPRDFVFSAGIGGWSTVITVQKDGTFTGQWHDADMGLKEDDHPNGVMHLCEFEGKFSVVNQVSDTEFELQLDYVRPTHAAEEVVEDGVLNIWVDDMPYGLGTMTEKPVSGWHLYLPGMSSAGFPDAVTMWWRTEGWDKDASTLNGYGLVGSDSDGSTTYALFSRNSS